MTLAGPDMVSAWAAEVDRKTVKTTAGRRIEGIIAYSEWYLEPWEIARFGGAYHAAKSRRNKRSPRIVLLESQPNTGLQSMDKRTITIGPLQRETRAAGSATMAWKEPTSAAIRGPAYIWLIAHECAAERSF